MKYFSFLLVSFLFLAGMSTVAAEPIDREALVKRHHVTLNAYDPANPFQVGNGEFAFAVDATGLQTFLGLPGTYSAWAWHTFPNPEKYREEETWAQFTDGDGRSVPYAFNLHTLAKATPEEQARVRGAHDWFRRAPHRLHLGRIGFVLTKSDGTAARPEDLKKIEQTLELWTGSVESSFEVDGVPVKVSTCCHPEADSISVQVQSSLIAEGRLAVFWHFPYIRFDNCTPTWDAASEKQHQTETVRHEPRSVELRRQLDDDHYHVSISWNAGQWSSPSPHRFLLTPSRDEKTFEFACGFSAESRNDWPQPAEIVKASKDHWPRFWKSGGAVDLSGSKDPRWRELERRIVLSQYLTAIQSTGSSPPQESGLYWNSWYGKFHLEMTAWHGVHFVLWGRAPLLDGWMRWMQGPGLQAAKRQATKQGFQGVRWMKMIGPDPQWETPSGAGPFRLTQQGHAIYWAELMYRERPNRETLEKFRDIVLQSADFMADFVWWDEKTERYVLGPPLLSGSESTPPGQTFNSTVELSYWFYGLQTAQRWRERLELPRNEHWDRVLAHLSKPPVVDGRYVDAEPFPEFKKNRHSRPAWLEAFGCMPGVAIDHSLMNNTFETIWGDIKNGVPWQIWGCDFPMLAMTAARLDRPHDAVDALLLTHKGNHYQPNGFNNAGSVPYLPASGGLLWAVAMMTAGWDGCPDRPTPGFPDDGTWNVQWEGLKKSP